MWRVLAASGYFWDQKASEVAYFSKPLWFASTRRSYMKDSNRYVHLLIYTIILMVIQIRIPKPTYQFANLPKQETAITECNHIPSKYLFEEVLVSRIERSVKQQEFSVLAMLC